MKNDAVYLATMRYAGRLLQEGLISSSEYAWFERKMNLKYHPKYTGILADIDLIIPE